MSDLKELYIASQNIEEVTAERGVFLCVDEKGDPSGELFRRAAELLYTVVYRIRNQLKKAGRLDFKVSRLEFRWMSDPGEKPKSEWSWRLMLRIPDEITQTDLREAREFLRERRGINASAVKRVSWREGRALQVIQVGSDKKSEEIHSELRLRADELGYRVRGSTHEIYISKPQRVTPGKIRRIIRLPIALPRPDYARGSSLQQPVAPGESAS